MAILTGGIPSVLRVGDSHTLGLALYGNMVSRLGPLVTWVGSQTTGDGPHEGHGGWALNAILGHLDGWLKDSQPDIVTLEIGTNDAAGNRTPEAMLADLKTAGRKIGKYGAKLILVTIPPYPAKASTQVVYNVGILGVANDLRKEGFDVRVADVDAVLTTEDLGSDQIHLKQSGILKESAVIADQIRAAATESSKASKMKIAAVLAAAALGVTLLVTRKWWWSA